MRLSPRSQIVATLGLLLALVLTSCAAPKPTAPTPAAPTPAAPTPAAPTPAAPTPTPTGPYGELKVALASCGFETFDPIGSGTFSALIFDYLVRTEPSLAGEELRVGVGIAERWEMAPDGLSWIFYIRKGVKFHNGDPLTAADVKFNLDRSASPDVYYQHVRDSQERAEVLDDYTVRVYTKGTQPYYPRYVNLINGYNGMIMPKAYTEKIGIEAFKTRPVGSGPFKYVRRVPGDMVEFEALTEHYRIVPAFKKLTIIVVPEETTRAAMVKTGALDIVQVGLDQGAELEAAGFKTAVVGDTYPEVAFFGSYDPRAKSVPAGDIRVREALSLAINRDELGRTLFHGKMGPPMPTAMAKNQPDIDLAYWRPEAAKMYGYDLERAKQLLKDAGYANGFNIKLYYFPSGTTPYMPTLTQAIQGYWLKIGVKAEINVRETSALRPMWGYGDQGVPIDEMVGQACMFPVSGNPFVGLSLSGMFDPSGSPYLLTRGVPPGPEVASLIKTNKSEMNDAKRREAIAKLLRLVVDTWVRWEIGSVPIMVALGPRVDVDFPPGATSLPRYLDLAKHRKP